MIDCNQLFGCYIHHFPYAGLSGEESVKEQHERGVKTAKQIQSLLKIEEAAA